MAIRLSVATSCPRKGLAKQFVADRRHQCRNRCKRLLVAPDWGILLVRRSSKAEA